MLTESTVERDRRQKGKTKRILTQLTDDVWCRQDSRHRQLALNTATLVVQQSANTAAGRDRPRLLQPTSLPSPPHTLCAYQISFTDSNFFGPWFILSLFLLFEKIVVQQHKKYQKREKRRRQVVEYILYITGPVSFSTLFRPIYPTPEAGPWP